MRRTLRIALVAALWAPVFVGIAGYARSLDAADFSGFDMGAKGTAVQFIFNSPSLGIPAQPTGEMNLAYSEAKLQSGPSAYGLGSAAWPGQVAAALPIFLQGEIERQSGGQFDFPVDLPGYPVRAESFHPQGPPSASLDAGTMHMRSSAKERSAEGISYLNRFSVPFIGSMGNQSSFAQNGFDQDGAVAVVEAAATDVALLDGLIKIDSVVTRATARSDGVKGTLAGVTTISGAEVAGMAVSIDSNGVHIADQSVSTAAQQQALNQVLNQAGVSMELAKPVDSHAGPKASRSLNGLLISVNSSTIEPLIAALPDELENQIRGQVTFDQTIAIQIAPAVVTAGAVRAITFEPPSDVPVAPTAPEPVAPTDVSGTETSVGEEPVDTTPSATGETVTGGQPIALAPVKTSFDGVPLWLVIVLVLAALVSSRPLTMLADRILAVGAGAARCPDEES